MHNPIIIVGAARSGTNMLRDLLVKHPRCITWPCDEINYIWRHGNRDFPHEEFTRKMATDPVKLYIRNAVERLSDKQSGCVVVEKTCATSLRCAFADEVFPNAKFVHIYRDGRAVAASAALRWNARIEPVYLLKKARYVPAADLPYYAIRYLQTRVYRLFSGKKRLSTWGPRFDGMDEVFQRHDLPVACAIQWSKCIDSARSQLGNLADGRVYEICYEQFIANPMVGLVELAKFLELEIDENTVAKLVESVSTASVGKWESQLSHDHICQIEALVGDNLNSLGYSGYEG